MWKRSCVTFDDLGLSEAQRMAIKKVEVQYMDKVFSLRNRFMIKRLELRGLLRDPNAAEKAIREKAKEFGALQGALQEKIIDYQIEIRAILTAEQVRLWCTMEWFRSMRGWGRGREGR
jgi:Spy/CpxP family protein refolding chaperone